MRVLGIESSCDETACAIVELIEDTAQNGAAFGEAVPPLWVRADVVASQIELHNRWGGIVPEIAARHHIKNVLPTLDSALQQAGIQLGDIEGIAVTRGPGLVGALLVAVQVGKALAFARGLPLIGVNHLEGHLLAAYLCETEGQKRPPLPHLALLVSGGHTALVHVRGLGDYSVLGSTSDDAAGEAFDKVGKILGLGYPAGPHIDRLAEHGNPSAFRFPRAMTGRKRGLQLSFSGLKTAAAMLLAHRPTPQGHELADFCASFQAAIVEQLQRKTALALDQLGPGIGAVVVSGGVACNRGLRASLANLCRERGIDFFAAKPRWCADNAAMIAAAGALRLRRGERSDEFLNATATLPLSA
ncbi:MAG: tRNA (adenosine(37)-N6)-threonylcarbamoyltransferase complex transferase subunit TsaD [Myxococcales bacterium]|nr:tRNA (adenosine(37)-N6)-threonylcarbamoyltransferase complex transferase subunit TsaD [Myxococcales bacterium]